MHFMKKCQYSFFCLDLKKLQNVFKIFSVQNSEKIVNYREKNDKKCCVK